MSYVIYNINTTYILRARARSAGCFVEHYKSESAAKAALTRLDNKGKLGKGAFKEDFAIAEVNEFHANIEKQVERTNMMSGEKFMEPINTPSYCSPASESYWSM